MLAILEDVGYMARIAFIMDRIFRKFGLSGKSFIPMLIGTGCGVPGVMASRTIENDRDRKMTILTTTFIPCGAKMPIIGLIAGALFHNAGWVATSAYFIGVAAIVISGIILKKTRIFAGDPAPFVMELPAYHAPSAKNVLHSMWERGWSFIKRAGTVILVSAIVIWFMQGYGWEARIPEDAMAADAEVVETVDAPVTFGAVENTSTTAFWAAWAPQWRPCLSRWDSATGSPRWPRCWVWWQRRRLSTSLASSTTPIPTSAIPPRCWKRAPRRKWSRASAPSLRTLMRCPAVTAGLRPLPS